MGAPRIILKQEHAAAIRAAALAAFPAECCGLLIGDAEGAVHAVVPAPNRASDPARHFEIDPQILFDHMRSARDTNMRIVGHYHSHPNGRAEPSDEDRRWATDPDAVWLIAAVKGDGVNGEGGGLRAFVPAEDGFREIPIEA